MPNGLGNAFFKLLIALPPMHRFINPRVISSFADSGPLPGRYTTRHRGAVYLWEMLHKEYFSLEVPKPSQEEIDVLPDHDAVLALFKRKGPATD